MKEFYIAMLVAWAYICIVSFIVLTIYIFGFIPESRQIVGPIAFGTLIIGIPTLITIHKLILNIDKL